MDLDDRQREAVQYAGGPLKVEAGPGSGKTRVIVERVVKLAAGGMPQESILCVTFTKKAAGEMADRLQGKGIMNAKVETIHSFCLDMLRENRTKTGVSDGTRVFSGMAKLVWCVKNRDSFGLDGDVIRLDRDPAGIFSPMIAAISVAKRELIYPEDLEMYTAGGPGSPDDQAWFDMLAELCKVYRAYESYKRENNLIDHDDTVAEAVRLLQNDASVLKSCKEKYRHILVDEFQDNNYAQFLLVRLLADRDITVVGDGDQSIMGFQGAFGGIFGEFESAYKSAKTVRLDRNYRCSANISELSARLLADRSGAAKPGNPAGEPVTVAAAADEEAERQAVAEEIIRLGTRDVAVLCRTNRACELFAETLRSNGIRATMASAGGMMRNAAAVEVVSLLRVADSPQTAGVEISWLLKRRGISEHNIAGVNRLARSLKNRGSQDDHVLDTMRTYTGSDQDAEIREIAGRLDGMVEASNGAMLTDTVRRITMEYSGLYRENANSDGPGAARNLAALNAIHALAEDYESHYRGDRLSGFIECLDMAGEPDGTDASSGEGADAVSVLTMHRSKGKEFGTVFVTGLHEGGIPGRWRRSDFGMPAQLLKGSGRAPDSEEMHARESRNLLYVAMTRAKDRLYLSYPRLAGDSTRPKEPSGFLADIVEGAPAGMVRTAEWEGGAVHAESDPLDVLRRRVQDEACAAIRESRLDAAASRLAELARLLYVQKHGGVEGFEPPRFDMTDSALPEKPPLVSRDSLRLSASAVKTYLDCPLRYKYRSILAIPDVQSLAGTKGTIIHDVADELAKERLAGREPDVEAGVRRAEDAWEDVRRIYGDGPKYESAAAGLGDMIRRYAEWEAASPNQVVETEAKFTMHVDDIRYGGKIDRVERNGNGGYEIVDFKTGSSILPKKDVALDPQLNIYAAAARDRYGKLPEKVSLVYLEKDAVRDYAVTPESLEEGLDVVRGAANGILGEKFEPAPAYRCKWCPYRGICPAMVKDEPQD